MDNPENPARLIPFQLPDLGLGEEPIVATVWFAKAGEGVIEGDRLLEIMVGDATIDLPSPATGTLAERSVREDERLESGQVLGYVRAAAAHHYP
jgi:pyruvate/2-oxoglutarate dehydrogenase complex dihydrolipoamide acyltransferase (E2) component